MFTRPGAFRARIGYRSPSERVSQGYLCERHLYPVSGAFHIDLGSVGCFGIDGTVTELISSSLRRHYPEQVQRSASVRRPLSPVPPSSRFPAWHVRSVAACTYWSGRVSSRLVDQNGHDMGDGAGLSGLASMRTTPELSLDPAQGSPYGRPAGPRPPTSQGRDNRRSVGASMSN
jgi:hypothetical protein